MIAEAADDITSQLVGSNDETIDEEQCNDKVSQINPTFPTTTENMDIYIAGNKSYEDDMNTPSASEHSTQRSSRKGSKSSMMTKNKFFAYMDPSPRAKPMPKYPKPQARYVSNSAPLTHEEIIRICDKLMNGKKVVIDDPNHLQDILIEFAKRRQIAMENSEYLKSKKIDDITTELKKKFAARDLEDLFRENLKNAKERHQQAIEALEKTKQTWKEKEAEFKEKTKQEEEELIKKFDQQEDDLESKWMDPTIQRRFNKQSKVLLQQKAIEKYMVLAGQLEQAEEIKKINRDAERRESMEKASAMQAAYDADANKLLAEQKAEREDLMELHAFQLKAFNKEREEALALAERRVRNAAIQEEEASSITAFAAKKKAVEPMSIPITPVTITNKGLAPSCGPGPLSLPPLQVKKKRRR